jgi:nondiscriminating glutamyl-tRNA synthetase
MKVRFAPSPTGYLHVGGLRTALFNYLYAKKLGGTFLLRIEDTDQSRKVDGAVENLIKSLQWAGLDFDEGPGKDLGNGPYAQSERLDIYHNYIQQLLDDGHAYKCFCSTERLTQLRETQAAQGMQTRYDGLCRHMDKEAAENRAQNEAFVVRMLTPETGELRFKDEVRGTIVYPFKELDDQVILKQDGFPTYHLANVVDDHLMGVDTVIRGEEWLPSTPKHILLYQYFKWELPTFAHLPLLLNPDRSKLSKRQGDVAVEDYRDKGFLPDALINFVALLGWNPGDNREIFTMQELSDIFTLKRVNKAGAVFDIEKLNWMNGQYIRALEPNIYLNEVRQHLPKNINADTLNDAALMAVRESLSTWKDLEKNLELFVTDDFTPENDEAKELVNLDTSKIVFKAFIDKLNDVEIFDIDGFKSTMQAIQKETGVKGKFLWMPVRIAITGHIHGPELPLIIEAFGKEKIETRLKAALK